ncbi:MAG: lysylphosphatidylglycerol synthase domain-containing protein [Bacteroidota bacterium]
MRLRVMEHIRALEIPVWVRWSIKAIVSGIALYYVIYQIQLEAVNWQDWWTQCSGPRMWAIGAALALLPLNLGLEVAKWRLGFLDQDNSLGRLVAWRGILIGVGLGLFTPNRLGEYAGRLWQVQTNQRWNAGVWTWLGRMAQMTCTCLLGLLSLYFLLAYQPIATPEWWNILASWGHWGGVGALLAGGCLLALYFILPQIHTRIPLKWYQRLGYTGHTIPHFPSPQRLVQLLGLSALRYGVFTIQYVMLLWACGADGGLGQLALMVGLVFLIKSFFPTVALAELGVRESVALTVMGVFALPPSVAVMATLMLFLVNLALPGMVGISLLYLERKAN